MAIVSPKHVQEIEQETWKFKPGRGLPDSRGSTTLVNPSTVTAHFRHVLRGWLLSKPKTDRLQRVKSTLLLNAPLPADTLHEFQFVLAKIEGHSTPVVARIRNRLQWKDRKGGPRFLKWPLEATPPNVPNKDKGASS